MRETNPHVGSSLDVFLKEEGVLKQTRAAAPKEVTARRERRVRNEPEGRKSN